MYVGRSEVKDDNFEEHKTVTDEEEEEEDERAVEGDDDDDGQEESAKHMGHHTHLMMIARLGLGSIIFFKLGKRRTESQLVSVRVSFADRMHKRMDIVET